MKIFRRPRVNTAPSKRVRETPCSKVYSGNMLEFLATRAAHTKTPLSVPRALLALPIRTN